MRKVFVACLGVIGKALAFSVVQSDRHDVLFCLNRLQQQLRLPCVFKLEGGREVAARHLCHHCQAVKHVLLERPTLVDHQQQRRRHQRQADGAQHQAVEFMFDQVGCAHTSLFVQSTTRAKSSKGAPICKPCSRA